MFRRGGRRGFPPGCSRWIFGPGGIVPDPEPGPGPRCGGALWRAVSQGCCPRRCRGV